MDEEQSMVKATATVTCKAAEIEEDNDIPKKVYLNFKLKDGNQLLYREFLRGAMKQLEMFMLPGTNTK